MVTKMAGQSMTHINVLNFILCITKHTALFILLSFTLRPQCADFIIYPNIISEIKA